MVVRTGMVSILGFCERMVSDARYFRRIFCKRREYIIGLLCTGWCDLEKQSAVPAVLCSVGRDRQPPREIRFE